MSSILLYHHLGLGDHFMCHGIVREYCKKYDKVAIFSFPHNAPSVSFMFRDLKNLTVIQGNDAFARDFILKNSSNFGPSKYDEVKLIGFQYLDRNSGTPLEKQFYTLAGLDISKKWDSFHIDRDLEKERALFEKVTPKGDYAFIHEDPSRNYCIKRELVDKDCALFIADKKYTPNVIDYCTIIEKAKEIHVIDSSFMFLVDCLPYHNPNQKLFVHRYSRENDAWKLPILKKNWQILGDQRPEDGNMDRFIKASLYRAKVWVLNHPLVKRAVRKAYRIAGKPMGQWSRPDTVALINRYTTGKSFVEINNEQGLAGLEKEAHLNDAVICRDMLHHALSPIELLTRLRKVTNHTAIITTASIPEMSGMKNMAVFYPHLEEKQRMLWNRALGKEKSVKGRYEPESGAANWCWGLTPSAIESLLATAGFEVTEKQVFPFESAYICRKK